MWGAGIVGWLEARASREKAFSGAVDFVEKKGTTV